MLLQVMTTLVGSVLMITAGALAVSYYSAYTSRYSHYEVSCLSNNIMLKLSNTLQAGLALGVISIITGIVLAVDFLLSLRTMKISIG